MIYVYIHVHILLYSIVLYCGKHPHSCASRAKKFGESPYAFAWVKFVPQRSESAWLDLP